MAGNSNSADQYFNVDGFFDFSELYEPRQHVPQVTPLGVSQQQAAQLMELEVSQQHQGAS
eukprot:CAMPEP_0174262788 /NCGR_PEP_ID=MMETSP0439-20130205/15451_1 /TAXON_ID=0 /ORGANISM="Stereomyxa ramosa, Strain Chinc5" /LENGTH=59 /DNA_ID=CAMNT_0015347745 /DNA_START=68 /DNA_END=243 /DNA_ORIENTATION=-